MQIKIHRGTHQIGGCITEIKTSLSRIIIDMGAELPSANKTACDFEIDGVTCGTPNCDAVLITHYHGDHVGMYEKILPEIPIYMGAVAKNIYGVAFPQRPYAGAVRLHKIGSLLDIYDNTCRA